jgi:DNA-binding response OmpR family regulator
MMRSVQPRQSILIVEDEADIRALMTFVLERAGHEVVCVGNVAEARAAVALHDFDTAVIDLCLPDGRGDQIVRLLRGEAPGARIVVTSAYIYSSLVLQEASETGDDFLAKPFSPTDLVAAVCRPDLAAGSQDV